MRVCNKTEHTKIYFPKHKHNSRCIYYKIKFISELTNNEYIFKSVDEQNFMDYYVFTLNLKDLENGEYVYQIFPVYSYFINKKMYEMEVTDKCFSDGLIIIGDNKNEQYIEYTADNKIKINDVIYYE